MAPCGTGSLRGNHGRNGGQGTAGSERKHQEEKHKHQEER